MLKEEPLEVRLHNVELRRAGKRVQPKQEEHASVAHDLRATQRADNSLKTEPDIASQNQDVNDAAYGTK